MYLMLTLKCAGLTAVATLNQTITREIEQHNVLALSIHNRSDASIYTGLQSELLWKCQTLYKPTFWK